MNRSIKLRLGFLALGVALMGLFILGVTLNAQRRVAEVQAQLGRVDSESFRIAEKFKDRLRAVNDKVRRYATTDEAADWAEYQDVSVKLRRWLSSQEPRLASQREKDTLRQALLAYDDYLRKVEELHYRMSTDNIKGASVAQFNDFFEQSRYVMDKGQEMGRAHWESRSRLLDTANDTLSTLRLAVSVLIALLFLFSAALAVTVYWHLIAPLRVKLVESQALVGRHEKMAALGLLAAGVAHEIRNPLTAIKTALFTQQKKLVPGTPPHADSQLISREILRLERIVNEFLLFARPAQPLLDTIPAEMPLKEVHALLSPQLASLDIQLICEPSEPWRIRADPAQVKQVLINLVQNAADSIGRVGTIWLRVRLAKKRLANGEVDGVILEVADTGKGIPPEVQKRLCDPFFTTKETGTGLGLAIAARLVEVNGGALQYQTQPNQGSIFGIVLPKAP
jgi:signal transduction histidine kinase